MSNYLDARDAMTADDFAGLADDNHLDEPARWPPGTLLVVVGGLGIPSIVRVEPDGSWMCVAGIFEVPDGWNEWCGVDALRAAMDTFNTAQPRDTIWFADLSRVIVLDEARFEALIEEQY